MPEAAGSLEELDHQVELATATMVATRHDLHRHPELSFAEHRTTDVVRSRLEALGLEARPCPTETGAVAVLEGGRAGATVLLRADIDALPITEGGRDVVTSEADGVMHACGHDAHTAAMLGVAEVLAARRAALPGRYAFVFQPAEEALGGARRMVDGGVLDGLDATAMVGCHVTTIAPVGVVAATPGIVLADARTLEVTARGRGGHGATAGASGNALLAVARLAGELGAAVDGLAHDGTGCAASAGEIHAGTAPNVIPSVATLRGTLRTFTPEHVDEALAALARMCDEIGQAFECELTVEVADHAPAVVNDPAITDVVRRAAIHAVGEANVATRPPMTSSDDVSEFLNRVPGCYFFVGAARHDGTSGPHHSPTFAIDDACLGIAARVLAGAAVDLAAGAAQRSGP